MRKRLVALAMAVGVVLGASAGTWAAVPGALTDRGSWGWAQGVITDAVAWDIFVGYPDGSYGPSGHISRAEGAAAMARAVGLDTAKYGAGTSANFIDVVAGSWYAPYVDALADASILSPLFYPASKLQPAGDLTRAELATWASRALIAEGIPVNSANPSFSDLQPSGDGFLCYGNTRALPANAPRCPAYTGNILQAAALGVINGYPDGTFRPVQPVTRAEAAAMLVRLEGLLNARVPSTSTVFSAVQNLLSGLTGAERAAPAGSAPDLSGLTAYATDSFLTGLGGLNAQVAQLRAASPAVLVQQFANVQVRITDATDTAATAAVTLDETDTTAAGPGASQSLSLTAYLRLVGGTWKVSALIAAQ